MTVTAGTAGLLDAWIDFDGDGTFAQPGEQIFEGRALTMGANALALAVPCTATEGVTYSRFRVSTTGGLTPTGMATDGEVEDHVVTLMRSVPTAEIPTLNEWGLLLLALLLIFAAISRKPAGST